MGLTAVWRALAAAMLIASSALAAQATQQSKTPEPPAPGVSASLDRARAERGARMSVAIITYGPGEFVFEKFGHIALALTDSSTGQDIAFNWGMFDFSQPNFLGRFLTGDTKYWMEGYRTVDFNALYMRENRTIRKLELQLSAMQRGAIADYVSWNAQDANKYYRYDYYGDNCATRVRDLLNWALQGQLDAPFQSLGSGRTWRNETARVTASDPLVYPGIQVALGRNADHVLTKREESFLPELLANHLAALTVQGVNGAPVKLVGLDSVLFASTREPMPGQAPSRVLMALVLGFALAAIVLLLSSAGSALPRFALGAFSVLWFGLGGLLGTALLLAGTVTKHLPYMGANLTVLQLHPLMLIAALVITMASWRGARSRAAVGVSALIAILSLLGLLLQLVPSLYQQSGVVLAVVVPVQVAYAVAMWRLPRNAARGRT